MSSPLPAVTDVPIVCVYVDDIEAAKEFYENLLGLKDPSRMGPEAWVYSLTDTVGLYLEGGNRRSETNKDMTRASFILRTPSAFSLFTRMKGAGVRLLHDNPSPLGDNNHWFLVADPAGNIIEIIGGA